MKSINWTEKITKGGSEGGGSEKSGRKRSKGSWLSQQFEDRKPSIGRIGLLEATS